VGQSNYKLDEYSNTFTNEKISTMEFITEISNYVFNCSRIKCTINNGNTEIHFSGTFMCALLESSLFRYKFRIEDFYQKQKQD